MDWKNILLFIGLGLVGVIVLILLMRALVRYFVRKYDYNILWGSLGALIAAAGVVGFIFLKKSSGGIVPFLCLGVGILFIIIVMVANIKHCGFFPSILIFILQLITSVVAIIMLVLSLFGVRWSEISRDYRRRERADRRRREKRAARRARDYDDYGGY